MHTLTDLRTDPQACDQIEVCDDDDGETTLLTVRTFLSKDGTLCVDIETEGLDGDANGPQCRVYLNDETLHENPPYADRQVEMVISNMHGEGSYVRTVQFTDAATLRTAVDVAVRETGWTKVEVQLVPYWDATASEQLLLEQIANGEPSAESLHDPIPPDWEVQPLQPGKPAEDRATCNHCGLSWDDAQVTGLTPAPSGRCPFEAFHRYVD